MMKTMRLREIALSIGLLVMPVLALPVTAAESLDPPEKTNPRAVPLRPGAQSVPERRTSPQPQPRVVAPQPSRPTSPVVSRPLQPERRVEPPRQERVERPRQRYEPERRVVQPRYESNRGRDGDGDGDRRRRVYQGAGAAVIIGSIIAYSAYRGPNRDSVYARCNRNFPDFDYNTGTFENEDGDRETCPYLDY